MPDDDAQIQAMQRVCVAARKLCIDLLLADGAIPESVAELARALDALEVLQDA